MCQNQKKILLYPVSYSFSCIQYKARSIYESVCICSDRNCSCFSSIYGITPLVHEELELDPINVKLIYLFTMTNEAEKTRNSSPEASTNLKVTRLWFTCSVLLLSNQCLDLNFELQAYQQDIPPHKIINMQLSNFTNLRCRWYQNVSICYKY